MTYFLLDLVYELPCSSLRRQWDMLFFSTLNFLIRQLGYNTAVYLRLEGHTAELQFWESLSTCFFGSRNKSARQKPNLKMLCVSWIHVWPAQCCLVKIKNSTRKQFQKGPQRELWRCEDETAYFALISTEPYLFFLHF